MYRNYIFDLYGTLFDILTDEEDPQFWVYLARYFSYNGAVYEPRELGVTYLEIVARALAESKKKTNYPDVQILDAFKELYHRKGVCLEPQQETFLLSQTARVFRNLSTKTIAVYDGVIETFRQLKKDGKRIYLLSNGQREFTVPELKALGIYDYFDRVCSSSDIGICKPDIQFFNHLINLEHLDIKETIMVGNDHTSDIEGANRLGMDALYIHTATSRKIDPEKVNCKYKIPDGDFTKVRELIL
ncbi:MAG: HAD family hydrolase [Clostridia bacterium]|nr:HAD family hydrolase [Clostridia bacterium]